MSGLLFKEFYENRKYMITMYSFLVVMGYLPMITISAFRTDTDQLRTMTIVLITLVTMLMAGCLNTMIYKYDERKLWASFVSSTPQAARGQVKSKYLFVLANNMIAVTLCYIGDMVFSAVVGADSVVSIISVIFWVMLLCSAIELPFIIRFGNKRGSNLRAFLFVGLMFAVIVYGLFGDLTIFMSEESFYAWLADLVAGRAGQKEMTWTLAILPYASIVLYALSYKLSCILYQKGAESFEQ